jgi:hypothetical protein
MQNNEVINVIICDTKELAEELTGLPAIEYSLEEREAGIGFTHDGEKFVSPPVPPQVIPVLPE